MKLRTRPATRCWTRCSPARASTVLSTGIGLTCVADGALLDFMEVMDLSAVFGNALDNAIECEERIADPEKRLIHVSVSAQRDFVFIRFENYCEGSLNFSEGLPGDHQGGSELPRLRAEKHLLCS